MPLKSKKEEKPMSVYAIHFSPTGGTKKVLQQLCSVWENVTELDLAAQNWDQPQTFGPKDLCYFAVPAFEGRVPAVALARLKKLKGDKTPCVLVAVFGNRAINDTLLELEDELLPLGFVPYGAVSASAQHSVFPQYGAGRPDAADLQELKAFGQQLKEAYEQDKCHDVIAVPGDRPYIVIPNHGSAPFTFDREKCVSCGLCAAQCPVAAIDPQDPEKVDSSKCFRCMRCIRRCPTGAKGVSAEGLAKTDQRIGHLLREHKPNALFL